MKLFRDISRELDGTEYEEGYITLVERNVTIFDFNYPTRPKNVKIEKVFHCEFAGAPLCIGFRIPDDFGFVYGVNRSDDWLLAFCEVMFNG